MLYVYISSVGLIASVCCTWIQSSLTPSLHHSHSHYTDLRLLISFPYPPHGEVLVFHTTRWHPISPTLSGDIMDNTAGCLLKTSPIVSSTDLQLSSPNHITNMASLPTHHPPQLSLRNFHANIPMYVCMYIHAELATIWVNVILSVATFYFISMISIHNIYSTYVCTYITSWTMQYV